MLMYLLFLVFLPRDAMHKRCLCRHDISLVVSGGVDCGKRLRDVCDKMPQRYANRTAHLTARSDKCVAYVTNNKRLLDVLYTVEANNCQTRSIAQPLCDSRASCLFY